MQQLRILFLLNTPPQNYATLSDMYANMRMRIHMHLYLPWKKMKRLWKRIISLEKTVDLASLEVNVDVEVAGGGGQTWNRLNVGSEGVP